MCVWGVWRGGYWWRRGLCFSLMHQHSTHLDPNPKENPKRHTWVLMGAYFHSWKAYIDGEGQIHKQAFCVDVWMGAVLYNFTFPPINTAGWISEPTFSQNRLKQCSIIFSPIQVPFELEHKFTSNQSAQSCQPSVLSHLHTMTIKGMIQMLVMCS